MWEYFSKAAKDKDIKIRKHREGEKSAEDGPKRLSGYNLFTKEYSGEIPEGVGVMTHKAAAWKALPKEEQARFAERANEENKANGIEPKAKKISHKLLELYWDDLEK